MTRRFVRNLALRLTVAVSLAVAVTYVGSAIASTPTTFSGKLTNQNGTPYSNVQVRLFGPNNINYIGTTDGNGNFTVTAEPGTYALGIDTNGARPDGITSFTLRQAGTPIDLTAGNVTRNLTINVATIQANGYNAQGYQLSNPSISSNALAGITSLYPGDPGTSVTQVVSGASGLPTATFKTIVGAVYNNSGSTSGGSMCASDNGVLKGCLASPLTVTGDMSVDVPKSPAPANIFSGKLASQAGKPYGNVQVSLNDQFNNRVVRTTDGNGNFSVPVQPGQYAIWLEDNGSRPDGYSFHLRQPLSSPTQDLTAGNVTQNLTINVATIQANGYNAQGYQLSNPSISSNALAGITSLYPGDPGTSVTQVISGASGLPTATFKTVIGAVYNNSGSTNGGSMCASENGVLKGCLASPLTVTGDANVDVPKTPGPANIFSGKLTNQTGKPYGNVQVSLNDQFNNRVLRTTDGSGNFSVPVQPGKYAIWLEDNGSRPDGYSFHLRQPINAPTQDLSTGNVTQNLIINVATLQVNGYNAQGYQLSNPNISGNALSGTTSLYPGDPGTPVTQVNGGATGLPTATFKTVIGAVYNNSGSTNGGSMCASENGVLKGCLASPLTVTGDMSVDVPKSPAPANFFSGKLTNHTGKPYGSVQVSLTDQFNNRVLRTTDGSGNFSVPVQPGKYAIWLEDNGSRPDGFFFSLRQPINAPTQDLSTGNVTQNLVISVATINAFVLDSTGNPAQFSSITSNALSGTTSLYPGDPGTSVAQIVSGAGNNSACGSEFKTVIGATFAAGGHNNGGMSAFLPSGTLVLTNPVTIAGDTDTVFRQSGLTAPAAPTSVSAISPTSSPDISWNSVSGAVTYKVYRNCVLAATTSSLSFKDTALSNGVYRYHVAAVNSAGVASNPSQRVNVTVDGAGPTVSDVSVNPATVNYGSGATLSATVDDPNGVVSAEYFEGTDPGVGNGIPMVITGTAASATVSANLSAGVHTFKVRAKDSLGNWTIGTLPSVQLTVVGVVAGLSVVASPTNNPPALTWDATGGTSLYKIYRDDVEVGTTSTASFTDGTLIFDGTYHYRVSAVNAQGSEGPKTEAVEVVYDITAPDVGNPVFTVNPKSIGQSSELSASVVDSGSGNGGAEYYIGETDPGNGNGIVMSIEGDQAVAIIGTTLSAGEYVFNVRAKDTLGTWSATEAATLTIEKPDAPTGLVASKSVTNEDPSLSWTASPDAVKYYVYRDGIKLTDEPTGTSYVDLNREDGSYVYELLAVNEFGDESDPSNSVTVEVDKTAPVVESASVNPEIKLAGQTSELRAVIADPGSGIVRAEYYIGSDPGQGAGTVLSADGQDFVGTIGTELSVGNHAIAVRAKDAAGNWSSAISTTLAVVVPAVPTGLDGPSFTNAEPVLTWQSSQYASKYYVYRDGQKVGESVNTSYTDTTIGEAPQGAHEYKVSAADEYGDESAKSDSLSVFYDTVEPEILAEQSVGANQWSNSSVVVAYTCSDPGGSGIKTVDGCVGTKTVTVEGETVTGMATDRAGNTKSLTVSDVRLDTTKPTVEAPTFERNPKEVNQTTAVSSISGDLLSGVLDGEFIIDNNPAWSGSMTLNGNILTGNIGTYLVPGNVYTVAVRSRDKAGNFSDYQTSQLVVYDISAGGASGGEKELPDGGNDILPFTDPKAKTKLDFGFSASYASGASKPTGEVEAVYEVDKDNYWTFKTADLTDPLAAFDWMVQPTPEKLARIQGQAALKVTVNGVTTTTTHPFALEATEGSLNLQLTSKVILKIYAPGASPVGNPIYKVEETWKPNAITVGNTAP